MSLANLTIGQLVDRAADAWGDRKALYFEGRRWSFAEFRQETDRVAKGLIAAGVAPGEHVCLWLGNRPEYLFIFFAVARVGAVLVPINARFRTQDMAYIVKQSDATTLMSAERSGPVDYISMIEELLPGLRGQPAGELADAALPCLRRVVVLGDVTCSAATSWNNFLRAGEAIPDEEVQRRCTSTDPGATATILYTSGTTGFPKGVMHAHYATRTVMDQADRLAVTPEDVILTYLPLYHNFGIYESALMSPITGARQVLMASFDVAEALRLIEAERATLVYGFDTHFQELLQHPARTSRDLGSLRLGLLPAGMHSTEPVAHRAQELVTTITGYGMTEVGCGATLSFPESDIGVRTTMSGWPLPGFEFKIVDPGSGATQPSGMAGEICVHGYHVMQGYYRKPEETAKILDADGWLHTGDMGLLQADGCLRFLGRYKDMLKVGGENVDPMEVEGLLLQDPRVRQVAVVGAPDTRLAEVPVAFVVREANVSMDEADVIAACRGRIASFKIPRRVFFVDELPMTGSGKIQKYLLRHDAEQLLSQSVTPSVRPRGPEYADVGSTH
jgi:fatty-acyl-CoA synthase